VVDTGWPDQLREPPLVRRRYEQRELVGCPLADLVSPTRRRTLVDALNSSSPDASRQPRLAVVRGDRSAGQFSVNLSPCGMAGHRDQHLWWS